MSTTTTTLPISTSEVTQEVQVRMGTSGQAAIPAKTIMENFDHVVKIHGDENALYQKVSKNVSDYHTLFCKSDST